MKAELERESFLKELIASKYGTIKEFSRRIELPYTTVRSILDRGIANAQVENVLKICKGVGITAEELLELSFEKKRPLSYSEYWFYPYDASKEFPSNLDGDHPFEKIVVSDILMGVHAKADDLLIFRLHGKSMDKTIPEGSLIGIRSKKEVEDLTNGDIVMFTHKEEHSIKVCYINGDELIFKPQSTDPTYVDYLVKRDDPNLIIHGVVVTTLINLTKLKK